MRKILASTKAVFEDASTFCYDINSSWRDEQRETRKFLGQIIQHLLKRKHQPECRGNSWSRTINESRRQVRLRLVDRLRKPYHQNQLLPKAWEYGLNAAEEELEDTGIELPQELPWTFDEILNTDYKSW
jgi:hypothetical protein